MEMLIIVLGKKNCFTENLHEPQGINLKFKFLAVVKFDSSLY